LPSSHDSAVLYSPPNPDESLIERKGIPELLEAVETLGNRDVKIQAVIAVTNRIGSTATRLCEGSDESRSASSST